MRGTTTPCCRSKPRSSPLGGVRILRLPGACYPFFRGLSAAAPQISREALPLARVRRGRMAAALDRRDGLAGSPTPWTIARVEDDSHPTDMPETDESVSEETGALRQEISNAVVGLYKEHYGKGPTQCRTYVEPELVVVVLGGGY